MKFFSSGVWHPFFVKPLKLTTRQGRKQKILLGKGGGGKARARALGRIITIKRTKTRTRTTTIATAKDNGLQSKI